MLENGIRKACWTMHIECQEVGCTVHCPLCPCRYFVQICKDFHVGPIISYKTELNYQCCSSQLASCCAAGFSVLNSSTIGLGLSFEYLCVQGDSLMRILCIGAFAVSGYSSTEGRTCKPFNPLLGETYEADFPDMGVRFVSEKVSLMSHLLCF
jgi:hypothetical protein